MVLRNAVLEMATAAAALVVRMVEGRWSAADVNNSEVLCEE